MVASPLADYIKRTAAVTRPGGAGRKPQIKLMPTAAVGQPYMPPVSPVAAPAAGLVTAGSGPAGQDPNVAINEPATIVGDSGRPYIRVGDNPNGPEALSVTPPPGPVAPQPGSMSTGGVLSVGRQPRIVSMAAGGAATIGLDPYLQEQQNANAALAAEQNVQGAAMDTADKTTAATASTIQNTQDQQYGQLGVATPTSVDVASGAPGVGSSALARPRIATKEQLAQDAAARARALAYAQSRANSANLAAATNQGGTDNRNTQGGTYGASIQDQRAYGNASGDAERARTARISAANTTVTAAPAAPKTYQERLQAIIESGRLQRDAAYNLDPAEYKADQRDKALARQKADTAAANYPEDAAMAAEARQAKIAGKVVYTDPYTGARSTLTQADADMRDEVYKKNLAESLAAKTGTNTPFANLTTSQLVALLGKDQLASKVLAPPDGTIIDESDREGVVGAQQKYAQQVAQQKQEINLIRAALQAKKGANGTYYTPAEIDLLVKDALGFDPASLDLGTDGKALA